MLANERIQIIPGMRRMDAMLSLCPDPSCGEPVFKASPVQRGLIAEMGGGPHPHDGMTHVYQWPVGKDGVVDAKVPQDRYNDATKALTYLFVNQLGYTITYNSSKTIRVKKRERAYARA